MGAIARKSPESDKATRYFLLAQLAEACEKAVQAEAEADVARKVRDDAIRRAKSLGIPLRELAALSGLSKARVQQVAPSVEDEELEDKAAGLSKVPAKKAAS